MAKNNSRVVQECTRLAYLFNSGELSRYDLYQIARECRQIADSESDDEDEN